jgi:hypothetical protein
MGQNNASPGALDGRHMGRRVVPEHGEQQTVRNGLASKPPAPDAGADLHRRAIAPAVSDLERELLRRGVGALTADRHRCVDCGRTPLVGERIHLFDPGEIVCELCKPLRTDDPVGADHVRDGAHGTTVRIRRAA